MTYVSDLSKQQQRTTQTETKTIKLSYSKVSDKLLVNHLTICNGKLENLKKLLMGLTLVFQTFKEIPHMRQTSRRDSSAFDRR